MMSCRLIRSKVSKNLKLFFFLMLCLAPAVESRAMKADWQRVEGERFIVYYGTARPAFASSVLAHAQRAFIRLNDMFGDDVSGFWQQETRPAIYLYNSREDYLAATGQPAWSDGVSIQRLRVVYSFVSAKKLGERVIPHELAHIMLKELAGFDTSSLPVWFEEGVASLAEGVSAVKLKARVRRAAFAGKLIPFPEFNAMQVRSRHDKGDVDMFYLQAAGLADYLCNGFGKGSFQSFMRSLKSGVDFEHALEQVYGVAGTSGLEKAWLDHLKQP